MGLLKNGKWQQKDLLVNKEGQYQRATTQFNNLISKQSSTPFQPDTDRYHLYVSPACPWSHRTLLMRKLKGLEHAITISYVEPCMSKEGWSFGEPNSFYHDALYQHRYLHELYTKTRPSYTGRVSIPVLWDKPQETIVNNESADIIRFLNSEFDEFAKTKTDFYPKHLRQEIDNLNLFIHRTINDGVYRCGFTADQEEYELNFDKLFYALDELDGRLHVNKFLLGNQITESDIRLFPSLLRFDPVYYLLFKCNKRMLRDYKNLSRYMHDVHRLPGVSSTVNLNVIKEHYYCSMTHLNPRGFIPPGPKHDT